MKEMLKKYFTEIRTHSLYDLSKYISFAAVSMLLAAAIFLYRFLLSYPRDLFLTLAVSIGAFLLMTVALFISRQARKTENEQLREANVVLVRQKEEVEAKLKELQRQDTPPVHTISVPSILPCGDSRLHEIAENDKTSIN